MVKPKIPGISPDPGMTPRTGNAIRLSPIRDGLDPHFICKVVKNEG